MGHICLSTCGTLIEAWHNGTRCFTAPTAYGLHRAMGLCLDYLRKWSGQEPALSAELKARLDALDLTLIRLAQGPGN